MCRKTLWVSLCLFLCYLTAETVPTPESWDFCPYLACHCSITQLLSAAWLGLPDRVHQPLQGHALWQDTAASLDLCVPWAPNELLMSCRSGFKEHKWQGKNMVPAPLHSASGSHRVAPKLDECWL